VNYQQDGHSILFLLFSDIDIATKLQNMRSYLADTEAMLFA
jgi:hypothetical protein